MRNTSTKLSLILVLAVLAVVRGNAQNSSAKSFPLSISIYDRTRVNAWQWFAAPPKQESYGYVESLLRISVAQHVRKWDWGLEIAQPAVLHVPGNAVSPIAAQGQLGLGGTYYAANGSNTEPAAAFLKQGYVRFNGEQGNIRLGRFEFVEGQETQPKNATLAWLQANRISHRLIGNFGFSNAQRSFDGLEAHYGNAAWNLTAMAARADQGVFNMNGNPELNVDLQYLAVTRPEFKGHLLWRAFAVGYHDGRTGITKTDNRVVAVRAADHQNIRIGTYGGDAIAAFPAGPAQLDFLLWGALQNGRWGAQHDRANAAAVEGGLQFTKLHTSPWLRGGWFRSSGDNAPADSTHRSFFQLLPTPRIYARLPFYNLMNNTDEFVQIVDKPAKTLVLRADLHWLQLTSANDLWYQGGGAFDNKVFGYVGRPSNGRTSFASVPDVSADWQVSKNVALNFYYAYAQGKSVPGAIYPTNRNMHYGYVELIYRWSVDQQQVKK